MQRDDLEYVGFWWRVWAAVIDGALIGIIVCPILIAIYGSAYFDTDRKSIAGPADLLLTWVFPAVAVILFWIKKQATPGKMAISARIVDAKTGNNASDGQLIGRYFAYFLSALPLGLGMIWIAFDERKQGWHDKLAGTVVIHPKVRGTQNVETASTIQRPAIISVNTVPQKEKQTRPEADSSEEDFYEQAFKELESENKKVGLWAKVFAEASGNESLAKANYLKIRSGQLGSEHKQALLVEERQRQEEEKIAEMERQRQERLKNPIEQLRYLAKRIQSQPYVSIAQDLVNKLGGTFKDSSSWYESSKIIVNLYGETHEFSTEYDFAQWVKNDIAPRVLGSDYCNTGAEKN